MKQRSIGDTLRIALASLGGAGFFPVASGTFGSAIALALVFVPVYNIHLLLLAAAAAGFLIGSFIVGRLEHSYGKDPSIVVLDEAVGMWLVLASPLVPHTWLWLSVAFLLFRLFDIWKPFPIRQIDRREGGLFVMLDDVVAALYASVMLHAIYHLYLLAPFTTSVLP